MTAKAVRTILRTAFCRIFAEIAFIMKKLFRSYHLWIKLLSGICLVLFPFAEFAGSHKMPGLSVLGVSEIGAVSILLMLPQPDESARTGFFASLLQLLVMISCHFAGVRSGFSVMAVLALTFAHLVNAFRLRCSCARSLFRHQVIWYTLLGMERLIHAQALSLLAFATLLFRSSAPAMILLCILLALLYALLLAASFKGRLYLLSRGREQEIRRMLNCGDAAPQLPGQKDEAASMRALYEKVVSIMEASRPFLDEDYSLQDLSSAVYTNKTYVSKTINMMSGKNFRQFINAYRIRYSVEMMKKNPRLRVDELASMSGFHSTVTYTMAFKANMNETPGEYSQRLRSNLV